MTARLIRRAPGVGYLSNWLWIPKRYTSQAQVASLLTYDSPKAYIKAWEEEEFHYRVPRNFISHTGLAQMPYPVIDARQLVFPKINLTSRVVLDARNVKQFFQREGSAALLSAYDGILCLRCGAGKTAVSLHSAAQLKTPILIIVSDKGLAKQWIDEIKLFLDVKEEDIGRVGGDGSPFDWKKPITVALVQTLAARVADNRLPPEMTRHFGVVIPDECFPAGTLVDERPIESYRVGDEVTAFDRATNTFAKRRIAHVFCSKASSLRTLRLANGIVLTCTDNHPIWTPHGWKRAASLREGDAVGFYDKSAPTARRLTSVRITHVEVHEQGSDGGFGDVCPTGVVYNFEIEGLSTYTANGVVVHNCHLMGAPFFNSALPPFHGRRWGLSATPYREDGFDSLLQYTAGSVVYTFLRPDLIPQFVFYRLPTILNFSDQKVKEETHDVTGEFHFGKTYGYLARERQDRTELIVGEIKKAVASGRQVLVLTHSKDMCEILGSQLPGSGICHGGVKEEDRMRRIRECNPVIAIMQLGKQALNKPSLDTLFICDPFTKAGVIQQTMGRILRDFSGKKDPLVIVFEDTFIEPLRKMCHKIRLQLSRWPKNKGGRISFKTR